METDPICSTRIQGDGSGVVTGNISTAQAFSGSQSALFHYDYFDDGSNNWPIVVFAVPPEAQDFSSATELSAWFYFDTIHRVDGWITDPAFVHPDPGNPLAAQRITVSKHLAWPAEYACPNKTWFELHWDISAAQVSDVTEVDFNINVNLASSGTWNNWGIANDTPVDGSIDIYIDNVSIRGLALTPVRDWELY